MLEMIVGLVITCAQYQCVTTKYGNTTVLTICDNSRHRAYVRRYEEGDKTLEIVVQSCYQL